MNNWNSIHESLCWRLNFGSRLLLFGRLLPFGSWLLLSPLGPVLGFALTFPLLHLVLVESPVLFRHHLHQLLNLLMNWIGFGSTVSCHQPGWGLAHPFWKRADCAIIVLECLACPLVACENGSWKGGAMTEQVAPPRDDGSMAESYGNAFPARGD